MWPVTIFSRAFLGGDVRRRLSNTGPPNEYLEVALEVGLSVSKVTPFLPSAIAPSGMRAPLASCISIVWAFVDNAKPATPPSYWRPAPVSRVNPEASTTDRELASLYESGHRP